MNEDDATPVVLPVFPKLPTLVSNMSLAGHGLPSALQSHILNFLTIAELYPLYACAHMGSEFVGGYLQTIRWALVTKNVQLHNGEPLLQEIVWSLSLLKQYARNIATLTLSKDVNWSNSRWNDSVIFTVIADLQADIVQANRPTFQQLFSVAPLKHKRLLDEQLACPQLLRFNPHAKALTTAEMTRVCLRAIKEYGTKLVSWDDLSTTLLREYDHCDGPPVPLFIVKEILRASSSLRMLMIDWIPAHMAPKLCKVTNLEYLTIGIKTTEESYPSMIPVIAEMAQTLTCLRSLYLNFNLVTPIDSPQMVIHTWEFTSSSLTSLRFDRGINLDSDLNADYDYRYLPPIIKAPSLLEWRGSISLLGFANLLHFSPLLEEVIADIGCQYEADDNKDQDDNATKQRPLTKEAVGLKAINDAFQHGFGSHLQILVVLGGSSSWSYPAICSMISCCLLLTEVSLYLEDEIPIEKGLRLFAGLKNLKFLKLLGTEVIRATSQPVTTTTTEAQPTKRIYFPHLHQLGLGACDDQLLAHLDVPLLRVLMLCSNTCKLTSFDSILVPFPELSELCLIEATVGWDPEKNQAIQPLYVDLPILESRLVHLQMESLQLHPLMVQNLLLRSPLLEVYMNYSVAGLMAEIITTLSFPDHRHPWPRLDFLKIFYDPLEDKNTEQIVELIINLQRGIPTLTSLELPEMARDAQNSILQQVNIQLETFNLVPVKLVFTE